MPSSDFKIVGAQKTVAAAGTREPLATGAASNIRVRGVIIKALGTNGGNVFVGDSTVSSTVGYILAANEVVNISVSDDDWDQGKGIDLATVYLDVAVGGEGVSYLAVRD